MKRRKSDGLQTVNKKEMGKRTKISDVKNIVIHMENVKFNIAIDSDVYDRYQSVKIKKLIKALSRNIWIDKTYVSFKGNRFKDAFLYEDRWYEFLDLLKTTRFGKCGTKEENQLVLEILYTIAIHYMLTMLEKYGYDSYGIALGIPNEAGVAVEYIEDTRTSWNF